MLLYGLAKEAYHETTDSRDSCIGAIHDSAVSSYHQATIHDLLSEVPGAVPAMRCQQYSLLQDVQFVHRAVSEHVSKLS